MGDFVITSLSDVSSPYILHPDWSFSDRETMIVSRHRTQGGKLFSYKWSQVFRYQIPLRFVDSAGKYLLNTWWSDQETLAFTLDTSETPSTVQCVIVNDSVPVNKSERPYIDQFSGLLQLEAIEDSIKSGRPFILDDAVFGLLDQSYNSLVG